MAFTIAQKIFNREHQTKATIWTIGVHLLLLLFLIFIKLNGSTPYTPVHELGIEVNIGTDVDGLGDDQRLDVNEPSAAQFVADTRFTPAFEKQAREMMTSPTEEAPAITSSAGSTAPVRRSTAENATNTQQNTRALQSASHQSQSAPRPQQPKYTMSNGMGDGGNGAQTNRAGGNEGNTFGNGDRGVVRGTEGASTYTGSPGSGNVGIGHSLSNRRIEAYPSREAEFRDGGKVVVRVTVNQSGKIINKQIVSASNNTLRNLALRKTDQIKFNKDNSAPPEQFGNITFVFKTNG